FGRAVPVQIRTKDGSNTILSYANRIRFHGQIELCCAAVDGRSGDNDSATPGLGGEIRHIDVVPADREFAVEGLDANWQRIRRIHRVKNLHVSVDCRFVLCTSCAHLQGYFAGSVAAVGERLQQRQVDVTIGIDVQVSWSLYGSRAAELEIRAVTPEFR